MTVQMLAAPREDRQAWRYSGALQRYIINPSHSDKADVAIKRPHSQVVGAACGQSRLFGAGSLPFLTGHDCTDRRSR